MSTSTKHPKIAIIGAGPVGLTLAAILHHHGITSAVFERQTSATARAEGGMLDIHAGTGQAALIAAGLLPVFRKFARPEAEATRIVNWDGTVRLDENEESPQQQGAEGVETGEGENMEGRGRPEIDRRDLKNLLIAALPEGTIRWSKGITSVTPVSGTQQWTLNFLSSTDAADPEAGPYDLVLGTDGAWSRVRPQLTDVRPHYSGVIALDAWISAEDIEKRPDVMSFIGRGSCMAFGEGRFLSLQRYGDRTARCYSNVKTSDGEPGAVVPGAREMLGLEGEDRDTDWTDEKWRQRFVDRHLGDFAKEIRDVVLAMTEQPNLRPFYMLPVGHRWENKPGVTLLGDAAHLMTPFAGVGVNVGMTDAKELAEGIVAYVKGEENEGGLVKVLKTYEEKMFERSRESGDLTARMMKLEFGKDGCEKVVQVMSGTLVP